ncbi:energy transducer TonB family protein [Sphingomonas sp. RS6]
MFDLAIDDEQMMQDRDERPGCAPVPAAGPSAPSEVWGPSRYADQPTSLRTRLCGVGGTMLVVLLFAAGALLTWTTYQVVEQPAALTIFDVAPPAAPPEPVQEAPPEPEKVQQERNEPETVLPKISPPEVQLASDMPLPAAVAKPSPEPAPPKEKAAPEPKPVPPAPQPSDAKPTWQGKVLAALNKVKRYPREASFRRQQGVPYIRFVMNRDGVVQSVQLERSSGFRPLDNEALSLPKRASPLPKPPEEVRGDSIELVVPVEFFLR